MPHAETTRRAMLASALAMGGCVAVPLVPSQGALQRYSTEFDPATQRPIITIPGTLGSRLRIGRDGPFVWGGPNRLSLDPADRESTQYLALPMGDGTQQLSALRDEIRVDGVLRKANARILGAAVEEAVYDGLVQALNAGGYQFSRTLEEEMARSGENPGSLEFPYDWRRDIVEAARGLDDFVARKAVQVSRVRAEAYGTRTPPEDLRFDFVAHSMGTLVLRYWLQYGAQDLPADGSLPERTWAGAKRAACAIFVAPPNLGAINAVTSLAQGRQLGFLQPTYPPALLGTHHSTYQLMTRDRHNRVVRSDGESIGSLYDVETWGRQGWGLLDSGQQDVLAWLLPDVAGAQARRTIAERYLDRALRRAEQFHRAMDRPGTPRNVDLFLVVGTGLDTPAQARIDPETGTLVLGDAEEGDGVVLRASALLDERQGGHKPKERRKRPIRYRTTLLLPGEHVDLTHNEVFADNLLYWLNDVPRTRETTAGLSDAFERLGLATGARRP
ncbi:MAG: hypothetical protein AAF334_00835 [Pseudomonadota bacterium]